jgi:predicted metalloprotease with PDZ domain
MNARSDSFILHPSAFILLPSGALMVHYSLSWSDPNEHLFDVGLSFTAPVDQPLLHLPAWRPGRYLIQNYAANVRQWSPEMRKIGKSTWRVDARAGDEVTVRYRFYAGVLDAGSSFLDETEAYFNGSNLFMMVEGLRTAGARLTIAAPADWRIETQLPSQGERTFVARDYDHLIDSPTIAAPRMSVHTFQESGAAIHLVLREDSGIDLSQYVEPVRAIVRAQAELFGGLLLREYRFLYHVTERWHGVEHEESCSITLKRSAILGAKPGDEGYDHFLSITSHEFFHLWNVKRILPAAFLPYDYSVETPTRLLWVMEGITSYYGDRMLITSGCWDGKRYLEHIAKEIEVLESSPGRAFLSLSQASFDGWLQEPAQMHDKANAWISFYNKGELVAMLLDLALRARGRTLDELILHLWHEYGERGRGLEEDVVERWAGPELSDFFARYVHGTDPLPYQELLSLAGVTLLSTPRERSFGVRVDVADGAVIVESVSRGGAAMAAGILPGDELIAIDKNRIRCEDDLERLARAVGDDVEVLTTRVGIIRSHRITPREDGSVTIKLSISESATDGQNVFRRQWLGSDR